MVNYNRFLGRMVVFSGKNCHCLGFPEDKDVNEEFSPHFVGILRASVYWSGYYQFENVRRLMYTHVSKPCPRILMVMDKPPEMELATEENLTFYTVWHEDKLKWITAPNHEPFVMDQSNNQLRSGLEILISENAFAVDLVPFTERELDSFLVYNDAHV